MYFFTLKESSQAKKVRSNGSLLRRHNTYRFSGRSQQELLSLPIQKTKMEFVRPSTLGHSNVPVDFLSGSTTLPDRRKPIMDLHNENHVEVKEAPPLANLPDDPTLTGVLPISVSEQPLTEECALPTQAEREEIRTETEKDGATLPQLHKEDGEPVQETKYDTIPPFEDFVTDSQDTVIEKTVEPGESAMLQQPVFEQALSALDCAINEHACDLGREHSMRTPENVSNEVIQNGCETVHQNGPVQQRPAFEQSEQVDLKVIVQASDSKERQNVNAACVTAQVTATVVVMMMLVGMLVALESTPIAESSMLRFIRGNPLITGVRSYIYGPVRNLIVSGLSLLWS
ncbi:unnamed protein product [Dicrocoelium dendriticum]|nr:unnamed protein product [Dicrocoelium dendriticum]